MRRLIAAAALAALVTGCQTAKVTLLPNEDGATVGAVAVLDPKTKDDAPEIRDTDITVEIRDPGIEAQSGGLVKSKPKKSRRGGFPRLFGGMPRPAVVKDLKFETGLTSIAAESRADLGVLLDLWQREHDAAEIEIVGYTDTVGNADDNEALSLKRAQAVRELLLNEGFKFTDENSRVLGRGERGLLIPTADNVDEPRNRRVVVLIR